MKGNKKPLLYLDKKFFQVLIKLFVKLQFRYYYYFREILFAVQINASTDRRELDLKLVKQRPQSIVFHLVFLIFILFGCFWESPLFCPTIKFLYFHTLKQSQYTVFADSYRAFLRKSKIEHRKFRHLNSFLFKN